MKNKNVFFKLMHFIGKYRFVLVVSILLAMFSVILQLYVPVLFGDAIDEIVITYASFLKGYASYKENNISL